MARGLGFGVWGLGFAAKRILSLMTLPCYFRRENGANSCHGLKGIVSCPVPLLSEEAPTRKILRTFTKKKARDKARILP